LYSLFKGGMELLKFKVLLVDDHALFRKGIASLLNELKELEIIGEASNGREGV